MTAFWLDILKLIIPVITALAVIGIKEWYEKSRERRTKQESLWRGIDQAMTNLDRAIQSLALLESRASLKKVSLLQLDVSRVLTDIAQRLSELDSPRAYLYSDYASQAEIVRCEVSALSSLIHAACVTDTPPEGLFKAIGVQAYVLKTDLVVLAEKELAILKALAKDNSRFDGQAIHRAKVAIQRGKHGVLPLTSGSDAEED